MSAPLNPKTADAVNTAVMELLGEGKPGPAAGGRVDVQLFRDGKEMRLAVCLYSDRIQIYDTLYTDHGSGPVAAILHSVREGLQAAHNGCYAECRFGLNARLVTQGARVMGSVCILGRTTPIDITGTTKEEALTAADVVVRRLETEAARTLFRALAIRLNFDSDASGTSRYMGILGSPVPSALLTRVLRAVDELVLMDMSFRYSVKMLVNGPNRWLTICYEVGQGGSKKIRVDSVPYLGSDAMAVTALARAVDAGLSSVTADRLVAVRANASIIAGPGFGVVKGSYTVAGITIPVTATESSVGTAWEMARFSLEHMDLIAAMALFPVFTMIGTGALL